MAAPNEKNNYQLYCGIDIAAKSFTAATSQPSDQLPSKASSFEQNPTGFESLRKLLFSKAARAGQCLIVMEATGTYWIELATFLEGNGFAVSVVNPKQAHNFAAALGLRPKNDLLDAQILCRMAQTLQPACWTPPPQIYRELYQRLTHRAALLEARQQFKNQLHALSFAQPVPAVLDSLNGVIANLTASLKAVEAEIETIITSEHEWAKAIALLQTIKGIGWLTVCWLVVTTLNFSSCDNAEALTHYAGLAPVERSSGTSVRAKPMIGQGGHAPLRAILYMAAGSAMRFNPIIKAYTDRLRTEKGKAYKVARCAAARKLAHIAFAIVKTGKSFDPNYLCQAQPTEG